VLNISSPARNVIICILPYEVKVLKILMACLLNGEQLREQLNYKLKNVRNSHGWVNERKCTPKPKNNERKYCIDTHVPSVEERKMETE
jgi:hypothetical protein